MLSINEKPNDYFKNPPIIKSKKILWNKIQTQDAKRQKLKTYKSSIMIKSIDTHHIPQSIRDMLNMGRGIMNIKLKELNREYLEPS